MWFKELSTFMFARRLLALVRKISISTCCLKFCQSLCKIFLNNICIKNSAFDVWEKIGVHILFWRSCHLFPSIVTASEKVRYCRSSWWHVKSVWLLFIFFTAPAMIATFPSTNPLARKRTMNCTNSSRLLTATRPMSKMSSPLTRYGLDRWRSDWAINYQ